MCCTHHTRTGSRKAVTHVVMSDPHTEVHQKRRRRLSLLAASAAVIGAVGVSLYGLLMGQRIEAASGIEGVGRLWWFGVFPVVVGIVIATVVTTRRAVRQPHHDDDRSEDFERNRAATLRRLSGLVASSGASASAPAGSEPSTCLRESAEDESPSDDHRVTSRNVATSK